MSTATTSFLAWVFAGRGDVYCEYCGRQVYRDVAMTASNRAVGDHRTPKAQGGSDARVNLAVACRECDNRKGVLTESEFRAVMADPEHLRRARGAVLRIVSPEHAPYVSARQHEQARRDRQARRLEGRLQPADPDCPRCKGAGTWTVRYRRKPSRTHQCLCTIIDPRGQTAHNPNNSVYGGTK